MLQDPPAAAIAALRGGRSSLGSLPAVCRPARLRAACWNELEAEAAALERQRECHLVVTEMVRLSGRCCSPPRLEARAAPLKRPA
jgi:hypothetical protein